MAVNEITAGKASIEVSFDNKKLQAGLRKASSQLKAFGNQANMIGKTLLGIGAAVGAPLLATIKDGAEAEAVLGKFNNVFKENADTMKQWADSFAASIGRSETEVQKFLSSAQDLLVPIGIDSGAAEGMSKQLTQLAIDLASFNNMADADVMRDLQAALTGSSAVMKKYGVIVNETAVKQELLARGIKKTEATETQKVMARLAIIMRGTTAAQGDAIRTQDEWNNSMKRLGAEIDNIKSDIGELMVETFRPYLHETIELAKSTRAWVGENEELIMSALRASKAFATAGVKLIALGTALKAIGAVVGTGSAIAGLAMTFESLKGNTKATTGSLTRADKVMGTLKTTALAVGVAIAGWEIGKAIAEASGLEDAFAGVLAGGKKFRHEQAKISSELERQLQIRRDRQLEIERIRKRELEDMAKMVTFAKVLAEMEEEIAKKRIERMGKIGKGELKTLPTPVPDADVSSDVKLFGGELKDLGKIWKGLAKDAKGSFKNLDNSQRELARDIPDRLRDLISRTQEELYKAKTPADRKYLEGVLQGAKNALAGMGGLAAAAKEPEILQKMAAPMGGAVDALQARLGMSRRGGIDGPLGLQKRLVDLTAKNGKEMKEDFQRLNITLQRMTGLKYR